MASYSHGDNARRVNIGDRIRKRLEVLGISQAELARRVGVAQPTIAKLIAGTSRGSSHLHLIARELRTTPEYLTGATEDPAEGALPAPTASMVADQLDAVMIKEVDIAFGMGGTYLDTPVAERMIPFARNWLRNFTDAPPEMLAFARGKGDSMMPTILDGDICLIDLSRRRLNEQDAIWAVAYGEIGMLKRLRAMPDGTVKIMSDNQSVRVETATDGELHLIGRVCGVIRKT